MDIDACSFFLFILRWLFSLCMVCVFTHIVAWSRLASISKEYRGVTEYPAGYDAGHVTHLLILMPSMRARLGSYGSHAFTTNWLIAAILPCWMYTNTLQASLSL